MANAHPFPPQPADTAPTQLGCAVGHQAGRAFVALIVNGQPIPLDPSAARELGTQLVGMAAVASLKAEDARSLVSRMESGLVLPPGVALVGG